MLSSNNTKRVIDLVNIFDSLNNIDKIRLAIHLLDDLKFSCDYNLVCMKRTLEESLSILEKDYGKVIVNFSKYTNLILISAKYLELKEIEKKKFIVEMLFNIYQNDFMNEIINSKINESIDVYDFYYSLNI